jgi:hypothetical protein
LRKRWRWLLISLSVLAASIAVLKAPSGGDTVAPAARAPEAQAARAPGTLARLPQRPGMGEMRGELFTAHSGAPAPPPPATEQPSALSAPPNPYRFAGTARYGGSLRILLARGDALVEVKEGESLDDVYQVRSATPEGVTLVYAPLGIEQQVPGFYAPDSASVGPSAAPSQTEPQPQPELPPGSPLAPR